MSDLSEAILASAGRLGVSPVDLATAVSYETAGTFDPWKRGPTTKWGQHRGLIQWGEPQRAKYNVSQGMPISGQMQAVERYLTDAGVKPGMGLMEVYSAINAGRVGRNSASDAKAGGAPGTVADKVNYQMAGHRKNAEKLLGGMSFGDAVAPKQVASAGPAAAPQPAMALGDVVGGSAQMPQAQGGQNFGQLAMAFLQNNAASQRQREEEAAAEQQRRAALFDGGLASLYG